MERVRGIENKLAEVFKNAPALPKNAKKTLVEYLPYLVLIGAVLQLIAAWVLLDLLRWGERTADFVNTYAPLIGERYVLSGSDKAMIVVGLGLLVVESILMLKSYGSLQKRERRGWELLFVVALLQTAYSVLNLFVYGRGFADFLFSLLGAVIGFWLLFQVREFYKSKVTKSV